MLVRIWCAIAWLSWIASTPAWADEAKPTPTPAQLERAKKAFADAKKLHDSGKLAEAVEKLKASYELSNNPLLLYNIGITMQELGSDDLAVIYYRKFLAEAPADAAQRAEVTDRIAAITRKLAPEPPPPPPPPPAAVTPPSEDNAAALGHHPIDAAPPDKPLDVTALVAPEAGLTVTLFVRAAGEAAFTATPMIRRQRELVGRIPAARMTGTSVQYYVEARDAAGTVTARSGKPSSPNVITLDVTASTQFYPDISDPPVARSGDREDPLQHPAAAPRRDAGSRMPGFAKWSATATAGLGLGLGVTMYFLARDHASALEDDATACGTPPCQTFDAFDRNLQRTGQREQTIANVALIGGAAAAVVAGYFWYRALTDPPDADTLAHAWRLAPALGDGYTGAAASVGF
jgi:hypothetical protein